MRKGIYVLWLLIFSVLGLSSCLTAKERAQKRLSTILTTYPDLVKSDTVLKDSIVTIPGAVKDSVIYFYQKDTVRLQDKNMTLKYFIRGDSTVYLQGECKPVGYINTTKTITHTIQVDKDKPLPWWAWVGVGASVVMMGIIALFIFRK